MSPCIGLRLCGGLLKLLHELDIEIHLVVSRVASTLPRNATASRPLSQHPRTDRDGRHRHAAGFCFLAKAENDRGNSDLYRGAGARSLRDLRLRSTIDGKRINSDDRGSTPFVVRLVFASTAAVPRRASTSKLLRGIFCNRPTWNMQGIDNCRCNRFHERA